MPRVVCVPGAGVCWSTLGKADTERKVHAAACCIEDERRPASPPAAATVLRTFAACAERFRAAGDAPLPVRIRFDASSSETSIVITAIDGRPGILRFRGELPGFAERVTKHIERGSAESQRDEMRNRIWFLWIESYLRATGEKYDGYDYASDLADERAEDRGLSFGVGFDVSVRQDRVEVQRIDDLRLREAGLVEGDEIVAIDDRAVMPSLRAARTPVALRTRPANNSGRS